MPSTVIQHAFNIGDEVFKLDQRQDPVRKKCRPCGGTGKLRILPPDEKRTLRRKCSFCYGKGTIADGPQMTWVVRGPARIVELYVSREIDHSDPARPQTETRIHYRGKEYPFRSMEPEDTFASKNLAVAEAKRRNAQRAAPPTPEAK